MTSRAAFSVEDSGKKMAFLLQFLWRFYCNSYRSGFGGYHSLAGQSQNASILQGENLHFRLKNLHFPFKESSFST